MILSCAASIECYIEHCLSTVCRGRRRDTGVSLSARSSRGESYGCKLPFLKSDLSCEDPAIDGVPEQFQTDISKCSRPSNCLLLFYSGQNRRTNNRYCYILTHPGTPCVFYDHLDSPPLLSAIRRLIALRRRAGIHCRSKVSAPLPFRPGSPYVGHAAWITMGLTE